MATLIPSLNGCLSRMTSGERRFARRLEALLEADYLCWYDIPVGDRYRHPDFMVLHPQRGLLVLEVKDWKLENIKALTHAGVTLLTSDGLKEVGNPLQQARQYAFAITQALQKDPQLTAPAGHPHQGKLLFPYGYGVVLANITRREFEATELGAVLAPQRVLCKDEMTESVTAAAFQQRLSDMFTVHFPHVLTRPQIDRIRYHLFPEIRIQQRQLFPTPDESSHNSTLLRVMDLQQEQLARSLGDGHRVIHGVAGSGKTMILGYRCTHLAHVLNKPILVLCYNVALAAKLEQLISDRRLVGRIIVRHFHGWCMDQLRLYNLPKPADGDGFPGRLVRAVTQAVDKGHIPRAQYGAVMIDEGHDFEPEWLKLLAQMIDPETNSLLLLYDDAQSIYGKKRSRDFSFAKLGIQARGRTTILRVNYRNTADVLDFAYGFAKDALTPEHNPTEEDAIPFVSPESAGRRGPAPMFAQCASLKEEARYIAEQLRAMHGRGHAWNEMCVLYPARFVGEEIAQQLRVSRIPCEWLQESSGSRHFHPAEDSVKVMTLYSSKGLEFPVVAVAGIGFMPYREDEAMEDARLLYVAMTRAIDHLFLTAHKTSDFVKQLTGDSKLRPAANY